MAKTIPTEASSGFGEMIAYAPADSGHTVYASAAAERSVQAGTPMRNGAAGRFNRVNSGRARPSRSGIRAELVKRAWRRYRT